MQVSFVIPCYNSEKTLKITLDSILGQKTSHAYEVIAVDNNSTDNTKSIIQSYENIKYLFHQKKSAASARNAGLKHATGRYVAFIDSDILLSDDWLEQAILALDHERFVGAQSKIIPMKLNNNYPILNRFRFESTKHTTDGYFNYLYKEFKNEPIINSSACIYSKRALNKVGGFDERYLRLEDADLSSRIFKAGGSYCEIEKAYAHVYWSKGFLAYIFRNFQNGIYSIFFEVIHFGKFNSHKIYLKNEKVYKALERKVDKGIYALCFYIYRWGQIKGKSKFKGMVKNSKKIEARLNNKNPFYFKWKLPSMELQEYCLHPASRLIALQSYYVFINTQTCNMIKINKKLFLEMGDKSASAEIEKLLRHHHLIKLGN